MATDALGLYVHIPYCVRKCSYCDFCSVPSGSRAVPDEYVRALCNEISLYKSDVKRVLDTVYFGGGTPSLLSSEQIYAIVSVIRETFDISDSAEITFEANPGTLTEDNASAFYSAGFNRVSLGLQSIHEKEMKKLGRIHDYDDFLSSITLLRKLGFNNVNVDLMYGIPYQTKDSFAKTLDVLLTLSPDHISAYGLILEDGTPLYAERDMLELPTIDDECDMYALCHKILESHGYEHYEISNYAKAGKRSRHNMLYWNLAEYIGVGAAAHSCFEGARYSNTECVDEYIRSSLVQAPIRFVQESDPELEYVMLKLRLSDGFLLSEYEHRFGKSFCAGKEKLLTRLAEEGLVRIADGRISLTYKGFYLSNSILVEFI